MPAVLLDLIGDNLIAAAAFGSKLEDWKFLRVECLANQVSDFAN